MVEYKLLTGAVVALLLVTGGVQAGEHGKQSHKSQAMHTQHTSHDEHKGHEKKHMLRNLISAVSKTGLNADQVKQVTQSINQFKLTKQKIKSQKQFPINAFRKEGFDQKAFRMNRNKLNEMKIQAKIDLFEQIYSILDTEQKQIFTREFTAPMIEKMIKKNMLKGKDMKTERMQGGMRHH